MAPPTPAWVTQPTRTVDGGYIVYVGSGEDVNLGKAHFKAESMALQDMANECSLDPKGARIEDHFDQEEGVLHRSYAKVAVEFQLCEAARNAVTPDEIRKLASEPMTAEVKEYQDTYDEPEDEELPEEAAVASNSSNTTTSHSGGGFSGGVLIASGPQYYVVSQQVAYVQQTVILAPPEQYPPESAVAGRPLEAVVPAQTAVNQYAAQNPALRGATAPAFSQARPNAVDHQPSALRQSTARREGENEAHGASGRHGPGSRSGGPNGGRRRRRRRNGR